MDDTKQMRNLSLYLVVSLVSYLIFVSVYNAGISVLIFVVIQGIALWFLLPNEKCLIALLPVFVFALNAVLYYNTMWRFTNFLVAGVCYGFMALWATRGISLRNNASHTFLRIVGAVFGAIPAFRMPFVWASGAKKESMRTMRRILVGVMIALPVLGMVSFFLSSADMIFAELAHNLFENLLNFINLNTVWRVVLSVFVGLFLFGILYNIYVPKKISKDFSTITGAGDSLILNVVMGSVLVVYSVFVFIQFRYLFAPPNMLPGGLNFADYARRGFFELLFLSFFNIGFILFATWLTKAQKSIGATVTKLFASYLTVVTVLLLVSSFYRMWLYSDEFGLTRLRLLVFGFLAFEAMGLIITLFYIWKPRFSIGFVYCFIAIAYYMVINLTPIDNIVARNQVDRYFAGQQTGIEYVTRLSQDALPQVRRLRFSANSQTVSDVLNFVSNADNETAQQGWRQWRIPR